MRMLPTLVAPTAECEKKPCSQVPERSTRSFRVRMLLTLLHTLGFTDMRVPVKHAYQDKVACRSEWAGQ